jgi:glycosyltransferase involved in cell wall biosynthesis
VNGISITIPCNQLRMVPRLHNCLRSIRGQDYPFDLVDISVVYMISEDGALDDSGWEEIAACCHEFEAALIPHIHNRSGFPLSLARNVGARRAALPIIGFCDTDMVLHPETFARVSESVGHDAPRVRVATIRSLMSNMRGESASYETIDTDFFERARSTGEFAAGTGGCIFMATMFVHDLHGWDERFYGYGFEDWAMTKRLELRDVLVTDLTERFGIFAVHQDHGGREENAELHKQNEALYHEVLDGKAEAVALNTKSWGGLSSAATWRFPW